MSAQAALPLEGGTKSTTDTQAAPGAGKDGDAAKPGATDGKPAASILAGTFEGEKDKGKDGQAAGDGSKDGKSAAAGELEIKLPEGMEVDAKALGEFKAFVKDKGLALDGATASALVAWSAERQAAEAKAEQQADKDRRDAWLEAAKKDKDFGGDKLDASRQEAMRFLRKFADKQTVDFLLETGLELHPGLFRVWAGAGRLLADDSSSTGGTAKGGNSKGDEIRKTYPNSPELWPA